MHLWDGFATAFTVLGCLFLAARWIKSVLGGWRKSLRSAEAEETEAGQTGIAPAVELDEPLRGRIQAHLQHPRKWSEGDD